MTLLFSLFQQLFCIIAIMTQLYQLCTLYTLVHFIKTLLFLMYVHVLFATVVPDDNGQHSADEDHRPSSSQTPPTPPVQAEPSQSPPPSPLSHEVPGRGWRGHR